jgi:hypothetical protein
MMTVGYAFERITEHSLLVELPSEELVIRLFVSGYDRCDSMLACSYSVSCSSCSTTRPLMIQLVICDYVSQQESLS